MKTVKDVLTLSSEFLANKGVAQARRCAEELLADVLGVDRLQLYMEFERPVEEEELQRCREGLTRLGEREPWQYVRGEVEFFGCKIGLNRDVLIPRPETEILVDKVGKVLEGEDLSGKVLWDVCCGSGCMGIALKRRFPELAVALSDASAAALAVAKDNAEKNDVALEVFEGDLLEPFAGGRADFVVCNPPYVSDEEYELLDPEVRDYEPKGALVGGTSGLEFYQRLAVDLKGVLKSKGKAWLEIGKDQGSAVMKLFDEAGWQRCRVEKDWSDHDRFFFLENC